MSILTHQVTADELWRMPPDGHRYELVRGELRKMPPAGGPHGSVAGEIHGRLWHYVNQHRLGRVFSAETGFRLRTNPDTVRSPDCAFITQARLDTVGVPEGYWPGAPDLAIEVVSPSDSFSDVEEKVMEWLQTGTRMVIVLDPRRRTASVYRGPNAILLQGDAEIDGADVVPGWRLALTDLFA